MKSIVRLAMEGQLQSTVTLSLEQEAELQSEVDQSRIEVVKDLEEAERALEVSQALEDLAFVASTITEATPREAALIQIAADAAMAGTGVDGSVVAPAMEEGSDGKSVAERIKDVIARILKALKELVISLYKKLKSYTDASEHLAKNKKERLKDLAKKVKSINHDSAKSIEITALTKYDRHGDLKPLKNGREIIEALQKHNKTVKEYVKNSSLFLRRLEWLVDEFYSAVSTGDEQVCRNIIKELTNPSSLSWMTSFGKKAFSLDDREFGIKMECKEFINGMEVWATIAGTRRSEKIDTPQEISEAFTKVISGIRIHTTDNRRRLVEKIKIVALTPSELITVIGLSQDAIDECIKSNGQGTLSGELIYHTEKFEALMGKIENAMKEVEKRSQSNELNNVLPYLNTINAVSLKLSRLASDAYSVAIAVNNHIVDRTSSIVAASVAAHSKPEPKNKEAFA